MRDCCYERDSGIEERDSGNNPLYEPRAGMSVNESSWGNWSSQFMKSISRTGSLAFKWSPIWSVTVKWLGKLDNCKAGGLVRGLIRSMIWDRIGPHKVYYSLLKTMTKFEKQTSQWLHFFIKKKTTVCLMKWETTMCVCDMYHLKGMNAQT